MNNKCNGPPNLGGFLFMSSFDERSESRIQFITLAQSLRTPPICRDGSRDVHRSLTLEILSVK